jgi:hypothetical protein
MEQVANIVANEAQSLKGPGVEEAWSAIARAIRNGERLKSRPKRAISAALSMTLELQNSILGAALSAEVDRQTSASHDPIAGAEHYTMTEGVAFAPHAARTAIAFLTPTGSEVMVPSPVPSDSKAQMPAKTSTSTSSRNHLVQER